MYTGDVLLEGTMKKLRSSDETVWDCQRSGSGVVRLFQGDGMIKGLHLDSAVGKDTKREAFEVEMVHVENGSTVALCRFTRRLFVQ